MVQGIGELSYSKIFRPSLSPHASCQLLTVSSCRSSILQVQHSAGPVSAGLSVARTVSTVITKRFGFQFSAGEKKLKLVNGRFILSLYWRRGQDGEYTRQFTASINLLLGDTGPLGASRQNTARSASPPFTIVSSVKLIVIGDSISKLVLVQFTHFVTTVVGGNQSQTGRHSTDMIVKFPSLAKIPSAFTELHISGLLVGRVVGCRLEGRLLLFTI